uniref:Putative lipocalin n=1 Tax=Ixodes ricinus TaxID=34613 RepID=A0A6B0V2E5_IXORI
MKTLVGALVFFSFILFSSVKSNPGRTLKSRNGPEKKIITVAYLLDENDFDSKDANMGSDVEKWLQKVNKKAQEELKKAVGVSIELEITAINGTSEELSRRLKAWDNRGHVYGGWILGFVKAEFMNRTAKPNIACVLTKHTIYNDFESGMLAYSVHQSLCVSMVPMLLTYKAEEADESGKRLSELIQNGTRTDLKTALNGCNKGRRSPRKRPLHHSQ